jgi:multiple antibiotic resistance protein
VFLSLTVNYDRETRRLLARRTALNSFILLVASFTVGLTCFRSLEYHFQLYRLAGGLIVVAWGWALLRQEDGNDRNAMGREVSCKDYTSLFPLTLPLTVGPGSISVAITLGANKPHSLGASLFSILAAAIGSATVATIYFCYAFADRLAHVLGQKGTNVIGNFTSFLLVCIGVQIVWNGASQLLRSLLHAG